MLRQGLLQRWGSLHTDHLPKGARRKRRKDSVRTRRLSVEALEDRRMLAAVGVTNALDVVNGDTSSIANLIADDGDDGIALREAIEAANNDAGPDDVKFDASLNGMTIPLDGTEIEITEALNIDAISLAAGVTVDAQGNSRIFNITAATGNFTLAGLTLTGGKTTADSEAGGAVLSQTADNLTLNRSTVTSNHTEGNNANGGGVATGGAVTLTNSTISGNHTEGSDAEGGGVFAGGAVTLTNSTVSGNHTEGDYSRGGGIYVSGSAIITQSTISGNSTSGFMSDGGGIAFTSFFGQLIINNSTIADNDVTSDGSTGGGVWSQIIPIEGISALVAGNNEDVQITNTIIATNTALGGNPDMKLFPDSLAVYYSLIGDTSGLTVGQSDAIDSGPGNIKNADPLLAALTDNGGPTETHYLLPGSPALNMGDPTVIQHPDQFDQRGTPFLRVYGGRLDIGALEVIVDDEGLRVNDVSIFGYSDYDLFDPKPSEDGPTPPIHQLAIEFIDFPVRDPVFTDNAVDTALAENEALYSVFGDASGHIPIQSAQVLFSSIAFGQPAFATVLLTFFEPLPDDRFTLTVFDNITDPSGNELDGESNAVQPVEEPTLPSGDGTPGGNFVARFTVDSRPEIGTWGAGSVLIDANGNFILDLANTDFTNRDLAYRFGFGSDYIFAGKFSVRNFAEMYKDDNWAVINGGNGSYATGFDTLAAYGRINDKRFRWLIDTDDDGVVDQTYFEPAGKGINGYPVAGEFDGDSTNGDEVGLFDGQFWYLDTNHDFNVSDETPIQAFDYSGFPIAGDFDGDFRKDYGDKLKTALVDFDNDGDDDLATYIASSTGGNLFSVDLNDADPGDPIEIDGYANFSFYVSTPGTGRFGFPGVRERPVAADFNADGIDDFGLWFPDGFVSVPNELSEWFLLLSGDDPFTKNWEVSVLDRIQLGPLKGYVPFSPEPFGNDLYAQFGNTFSLPVVGNFDPPVSSGRSTSVSQAPTSPPITVTQVTVPNVEQTETPPVVKQKPEPSTPIVPVVEQLPVEEETVVALLQVSTEVVPETTSESPTSKEVPAVPVVEEVVEETVVPEQAQATETEPVQSSPQEEVTVVAGTEVAVETPPEIVEKQVPAEPEPEVAVATVSVVVVTPETSPEAIPVAPVAPLAPTHSRSRVRMLVYRDSRNVASVSTQSVPPPVVEPPDSQPPSTVEPVAEIATDPPKSKPTELQPEPITTQVFTVPEPAPAVGDDPVDSESSVHQAPSLSAPEQSEGDVSDSPPPSTSAGEKVPASSTRSRTRALIFAYSQHIVSQNTPPDSGVDSPEMSAPRADAIFEDASNVYFNRVAPEVLHSLSLSDQDDAEESGSQVQHDLFLALADEPDQFWPD